MGRYSAAVLKSCLSSPVTKSPSTDVLQPVENNPARAGAARPAGRGQGGARLLLRRSF